MKTLLFTLEYPPFYGGVANYYGNLVKYWPKRDNISVLNNNNGLLINRTWPVLKWLSAIPRLREAIKKGRIDHIIVGHILPLGLAALLCRQLYPIKYSVILHGLDFSRATQIWRKRIISKIILIKADKIICANSYTAELVKSFLGGKVDGKIKIVNPGAEQLATRNSQLATQLKKKYHLNNKIILLSVGRLVKRKGFDQVIEALPEVLKQAPNLIYVIIGDGEELRNYQLNITNYELSDKIIIINKAADGERDAWYNLCDIFIMPAKNINGDFEGFGIVYLEANLAGKPVIASLSGGVGDAVIDDLNGLIVDPLDLNEIARTVIKLAQDTNLRRRLGEQGRERAIRKFNWPGQVEKIYKIIM